VAPGLRDRKPAGGEQGGILRIKIYPSIDMCGVLYF
jgi:hypothetical protein